MFDSYSSQNITIISLQQFILVIESTSFLKDGVILDIHLLRLDISEEDSALSSPSR